MPKINFVIGDFRIEITAVQLNIGKACFKFKGLALKVKRTYLELVAFDFEKSPFK